MKMKIGFATPAYYPAKIGASFYSQELAEGLARKGHEVKVVAPLPKREEGLVREKETRNGVSIVRVPIGANWERFRRFTGISYYTSGKMTSELESGDFDLIHSHHYGYFPATAGFMAAKKKGVPHVFGPYYHPPIYGTARRLLTSIYHRKIGRRLLQESDAVLPHTNHEKNLLLAIGAREDNMRILPNIVDTGKFTPGRRKDKTVLFVGNFIKEKGADVAMDVATKILAERKDTRFTFVGNIFDDYSHRDVMQSKKNLLLKTGRARFVSNLSDAGILGVYQNASVIMLPSMYEAFSRVLAEAQSCGCAIAATKVGGVPEVVTDGKSGLLSNYGDWKALEENILFLLDNPPVARKMGMRGRDFVRKNFERSVIVNKLEDIYRDVL